MTEPGPLVSEADLVAFADDRLDPARTAEVAAWLDARPEQKARVEGWRRQAGLLHAALDPVLSEPVPEGIMSALAAPPARPWRFPAAAAVAGIVIGVGAGWLAWGEATPLQAREMAEIGLSAHQVYIEEVRHPIEVTVADGQHLVSWLSNRVDTEIAPPDLTADGLTLLGGRVIPENGWPAAMLMYEDASGERYTLLIVKYRTPSTTAFRYAEARDASAFYWMDGEVGYVFSGPDDRERLLSLSREVYDQLS